MKRFNLIVKATVALLPLFYFTSCKETFEETVSPNVKPKSSQSFSVEEAYPGRTGPFKEGKLFGQTIQYTEIDNQAIFEGDIILTSEQLGLTAHKMDSIPTNGRISGTGRALSIYRWPNNTVFYTIDPSLLNRTRVTDAIAHWEAKTPLRFLPRTTQTNFVTFRPGAGCSSWVGKVGGQQFITLGPDCSTGNTIHEIGHTIGFWHEQSRADRDKYIKIHYENIIPGYENNFKTYLENGQDGFDYDVFDIRSIMMYGSDAFSKNNKPTITLLDGSTFERQRRELSGLDIGCAVSMYANLYVVQNDWLYGVNAANGQRADLGPQWQGTEALVSLNNSLYGIQAGHLWHTNRLNGIYTSLGSDYGSTLGITALNNSLYVIQAGSLWRVNPSTGAYIKLGDDNWNGTTAMTALNGQLYVVQGDVLYRVNPSTGSYVPLGSSFNGTKEIAALNGSLYLIQAGSLWRVNPNDGAYVKVSNDNWNGTTAMTALNGQLYVVQGDILYRIASDGKWQVVSSGWSGTQEMTSISHLRRVII